MNNNAHRRKTGMIAAMIIPLLCACDAIDRNSRFVKSSERDTEAYEFSLNMNDSTVTYDISFYTRIDCNDTGFADMPADIPLTVTFVSPSGKMYGENVFVPLSACSGSSRFSREYDVKYRTGLRPVEYGKWTVSVLIPGEERFKGLRGLGMMTAKTNGHGKDNNSGRG